MRELGEHPAVEGHVRPATQKPGSERSSASHDLGQSFPADRLEWCRSLWNSTSDARLRARLSHYRRVVVGGTVRATSAIPAAGTCSPIGRRQEFLQILRRYPAVGVDEGDVIAGGAVGVHVACRGRGGRLRVEEHQTVPVGGGQALSRRACAIVRAMEDQQHLEAGRGESLAEQRLRAAPRSSTRPGGPGRSPTLPGHRSGQGHRPAASSSRSSGRFPSAWGRPSRSPARGVRPRGNGPDVECVLPVPVVGCRDPRVVAPVDLAEHVLGAEGRAPTGPSNSTRLPVPNHSRGKVSRRNG